MLKSKMFIDEEEGCMGKTGCALHSLELTLLAIVTGQPLPGLEGGSQNHLVILLGTPAPRLR